MMSGEVDLEKLRKSMRPSLNAGEFVFVAIKNAEEIDREKVVGEFKEEEGITVILPREEADRLNFKYDYIAAWITLSVHSSLEAVGLTALFAGELARNNISCNVIAAYYHDHIFVNVKDSEKAMTVLTHLSNS